MRSDFTTKLFNPTKTAMSKSNRNQQRNEKIYAVQNDQRRQELEWRFAEENEQKLESVRNAMIFIWLVCSFAFAVLIANQNEIIIWAGAAGVLLVISYQICGLWLSKQAEDRVDAELNKGKRRAD